MTIKTKRWCDPICKDDGWRILISRYRPRALPKKDENWDVWFNQLGPSVKLHAQAYGKHGLQPLTWPVYSRLYLQEMQQKESSDLIACLAKVVEAGQTITLLCSSACLNAEHCHRSLLKKLIENTLKDNA